MVLREDLHFVVHTVLVWTHPVAIPACILQSTTLRTTFVTPKHHPCVVDATFSWTLPVTWFCVRIPSFAAHHASFAAHVLLRLHHNVLLRLLPLLLLRLHHNVLLLHKLWLATTFACKVLLSIRPKRTALGA